MRTVPATLVVILLLAACGGGGDEAIESPVGAEAPTTTSARQAPDGGEGGRQDGPWIDAEYTGGDGPRVAVLGDSLTVQSRDALRAALPDHGLRTAAVRGEGFAGGAFSTVWDRQLMLEAAAELGATEPEVAVVALGTNDAWTPDGTLPAALEALDTIVEDLGGACLVAVLVDGDAPAEDFDVDAAAAINARLAEVADHVVDWGAVADEPGVLTEDGIHPTPAGQERWAAAVAEGVEACTA